MTSMNLTDLHKVRADWLRVQGEVAYCNDPYDPGGPTNKGITLSDFAKWRGVTVTAQSRGGLIEQLKDIADDTVSDIYRTRYWQPGSCASLPEAVALMHFDAAVNHGVGGAIRLLQAALGVAADGEIGPVTLAAARAQDATLIIERYAELRRARYRALPHFWRFGLVLSVPGIGERTAISLIVRMPELGRVSREEAAALAGLAPFDDDSGKHKGHRHIAGGRGRVRRSLYAAALPAAFRWNPALTALYKRLTAKGKAHNAALTACARKLLIYANTVLARNEPWIKNSASYL